MSYEKYNRFNCYAFNECKVIITKFGLVLLYYRLMYAFFHIRTIIIQRNRYRPKGFSPRVNICRGMITVLIWKKAYINLFITYFNIELKRIKLTSDTDTKLTDMSDRLRDNSSDMETPTNLSSLDTDLFQTTIDSWAEVTSWGSREA